MDPRQPKNKTIEKLSTNQTLEIPLLVLETTKFIHQHGLNCEGIFRRSPAEKTFTEVKKKLNESFSMSLFLSGFTRPPFNTLTDDPHIAAHVLKDFLRNLESPLFPPSLNSQLISCVKTQDHSTKIDSYRSCLSLLPLSHLKTLILLGSLSIEIVNNTNTNKMSFQALGVVMGPCLIRLAKLEMIELWDSRIMEEMLTNFETILIGNPHASFPSIAWTDPDPPPSSSSSSSSSPSFPTNTNNLPTLSLSFIGDELSAGKLELFCSCIYRHSITDLELLSGSEYIGGEYTDLVTVPDYPAGTLHLHYLLDWTEGKNPLPPLKERPSILGTSVGVRAGRVSPRKPGGSPTGTPLNSPPGSPGSPRGSVVSKGSSVGMIRSLSPSRLSPMKIRPKSPSRKKKKDPATISKSFSTDHCSLPALSIDYRGIRRGACQPPCDCPMYQFRPRRVICQYCEHSSNSHSLETKKCTKCDCELFEKEVSQGPRHRCGVCSHPPTKHENLGTQAEPSDHEHPKYATQPKASLANSTTALELKPRSKQKKPTPLEFNSFLSSPDLLKNDSHESLKTPNSPSGIRGPPPARPARRTEVTPDRSRPPTPQKSPESPRTPLRTKSPPPVPQRSPLRERRSNTPSPVSKSPTFPNSPAVPKLLSIPEERFGMCENDPHGILLETNVILLCFSLISRDTFTSLWDKWGPALDSLSGVSAPKILVGTFKEYRDKETYRIEVKEEEVKELVEHLGCFGYVEVSSLRYRGFRHLADMCLDASGLKKKESGSSSFTLARPISPKSKRKKDNDPGCLLM